MKIIEIDGENGGGQILRSALSLSMITGQGFRMKNIRGQRSKPGLMRQHLTCVKAAAEVCSAKVNGGQGADLHDVELEFLPGSVKAGNYEFRIGSAGSTTLLFQTVLPALLFADGESQLEIHGGTHNPMAPTADFIDRSFLPQLAKMGAEVNFECVRYGFAPSGGGCIRAKINPVKELKELSLFQRGKFVSRKVQCVLANITESVGTRELASVRSSLGWNDNEFELIIDNSTDGAGNVLSIEKEYEHAVVHISNCGMKAKSAERVAIDAVKVYKNVANSEAAIDVRLADQLLLPMALVGSGGFTTITVTNHIKTNVLLIEKFCPIKFEFEEEKGGVVKVLINQ